MSSLHAAYLKARDALFALRHPDGHWVGELSTSALSTATAVMALHLARGPSHPLISPGLRWLADHQNPDGGWGDTVKSVSNISTTMLCRAAFHLTKTQSDYAPTLSAIEAWLAERYGRTPQELAEAVRRRYGKDRTFAVPILTTCALAGLVAWNEVPPLPFELACFPQSWFKFLRLHVVSYALPALIAIGVCIHHHRPTWNPLTRVVRYFGKDSSLRVLRQIQPTSGGYLEAIPLTSFVCLSLAGCGMGDCEVVREGIAFLERSVRPDGSWAIDSDLSTWVTTLSINALCAAGDVESLDRRDELREWLLKQQYREVHPYTGAAPGAWAWTPLSGGVPDADDTPGAMLALQHLGNAPQQALDAGRKWLLDLQNRDGGWPTFCRGWGHLPFDRSGSDLTAHAMRALGSSAPQHVIDRGFAYLTRQQRPNGSWLPLWFGNQHAHDDENPTYGTARVLAAYRDLHHMEGETAKRGVGWLLVAQNADGGWGGDIGVASSLEETALAVEVLVGSGNDAAVERGVRWLMERVDAGGLDDPSPIGFYFAKLWYFEKMYPIIFTVAALGRVQSASGAA